MPTVPYWAMFLRWCWQGDKHASDAAVSAQQFIAAFRPNSARRSTASAASHVECRGLNKDCGSSVCGYDVSKCGRWTAGDSDQLRHHRLAVLLLLTPRLASSPPAALASCAAMRRVQVRHPGPPSAVWACFQSPGWRMLPCHRRSPKKTVLGWHLYPSREI